MRKHTLSIFIATLFSVSFSQAQNAPLTFDTSYTPHAINDFWEYKVIQGNGRSFTYTVEVTGTESYQGRTCMRFTKKNSFNLASPIQQFYNFTSRDRILMGSITPADNGEIKYNPGIVLPLSQTFPAAGVFTTTFHNSGTADEVYDNCHYSYRLNGTDNFWFHTGSTVFKAIKLDYEVVTTKSSANYNMMESKATEWYVKGIGLVYAESPAAIAGGGKQTTKLIRAKINGHMFQ